ncbi:response regulator receiver : Uncharacterized protein OS=Sorangium cellulosum (strain So ce56) GN=sce7775 PE=4 SV=1: Response_reg [Gemmataceae bacterium]|nr:response regulator receiver : Uncharacterized protein OS=Sorangium cellulosum (strain So ce56) GN=sce7775 PE=4 SV=1: Response_reg [Gemmataceae bacterium]VTT97867.1 response regulator receiver : Uncharacterized protein OS=Sorangium cellulosum (strain So ce56) GN=sce7775 PE=4 SV=1: Response_reg [Gemmataceae bacterium]
MTGTSSPFTVLVVDDSPIDRHVAGRLIEGCGWGADFVADGADALEWIGARRPSVVLTDLLMPNLDGIGLVARIQERYPQLPVVVMSWHGSDGTADTARRAGAAGYVAKQKLKDDLESVISNFLPDPAAALLRALDRCPDVRPGAIGAAAAKLAAGELSTPAAAADAARAMRAAGDLRPE